MVRQEFIDILNWSYDEKFSDIHIREEEFLFYRKNGDLFKSNIYINNILIVDILEILITKDEKKRLFEKEDINKTKYIDNIRIRYNIFIAEGFTCIAIRLIDDKIISLEELDIYREVKGLLKKLNGLILITGKSGSGKTMTMNSIIEYVNKNYSYNILTLEDPIEYIHKTDRSLINQREVTKDIISYSEGLKSSLREDPDIIVLGEMRSLDSIRIALTAAETGHLVLSTLHTMGASKTIDRIIDVFPSDQQSQIRFQLSTVLKGIFSQELVKTKKGRKAKFEKIIVNKAIENLIRENKTYQIDNINYNKKG